MHIVGVPIAATSVHEIEECFHNFVSRKDIAIILINQSYAELIRHVLDNHLAPVPAVLEIPSKDSPYDPAKDSILRRAKVRCNGVVVVFKGVVWGWEVWGWGG